MGFKMGNMEGIREVKRNQEGISDASREMRESADRIKNLLDSIDLSDDEDMDIIEITETNMEGGFDMAHSEQIENPSSDVSTRAEGIGAEVGSEIENVGDAISKMESAGTVSEIGSDAATEGSEQLRRSEMEYQEMQDEALEVAEELKQEVAESKSKLSNTWK